VTENIHYVQRMRSFYIIFRLKIIKVKFEDRYIVVMRFYFIFSMVCGMTCEFINDQYCRQVLINARKNISTEGA